jgi:hypothetical protein
VKLLDLDLEALARSANPFAVVIRAHRAAQMSRRSPEERLRGKLHMVKELFGLGLRRADVEELLRLVEWFMTLPDEMETRFRKELRAWEEAGKMPYVTSWERIGLERGRLEGAIQAVFLAATPRFGEPPPDLRQRIESETDLQQVEAWLQNLTRAESWADLLGSAA